MKAGRHISGQNDNKYLFKYLLAANFLEYLEAGAVPALLLTISSSFSMNSGQLGLLGGIVYLSISIGGPFAGYLLRHYDHKFILGISVMLNNIITFLWALTPLNWVYSSWVFIGLRFCMGFTQCVLCVYLPLWTNEFSPKTAKTSWMSYLQVSQLVYFTVVLVTLFYVSRHLFHLG